MRIPEAIWIGVSVLAATAARADVEAELRAELRGVWALSKTALFSECTEHYTDNLARDGRVTSDESRRFAAGELARIDNVHVGWSRFDVNLSLAEPLLLTWRDGPFTVHEQRPCRVQLKLEVPREARRDARAAAAAVRQLLETFDGEGAARAAPGWNRRRVEPYPEGWEETRARYMVWKAEQTNSAVGAKIEHLLAEADRVLAAMSADEDYLASFGAGARARAGESWSSCESMLSASFYASGSGGKSSRGWSDGQLVAWSTRLVRALQGCYVEPPAAAR
jgi:hypothetical protein